MKIVSYSYRQHEDTKDEWKIDDWNLREDVNLIVGKNASGKTRILNTIHNLAQLISGKTERRFASGYWDLELQNEEESYQYLLNILDKKVVQEYFKISGKDRLTRDESGKGKIWAEEVQQNISFQISPNEIAVNKKRDSAQHAFLEEFINWGNNLRLYRFGSHLGQNDLEIKREDLLGTDQATESTREESSTDKNGKSIISLFEDASQSFPDFSQTVIQDMKKVGYQLEDITIEPLKTMQVTVNNVPLQNPSCIHVKEKELPSKTPQIELSQGMFRALALIIHINYILKSKDGSCCILIDDVGEGLDYERSTNLIQLFIEKLTTNKKDSQAEIQLIMTTNDQFIMNGVPLKYWSLIERLPSETKIYNQKNNSEMFERFKYTGLNNFEFFASNFFKVES